MKRLPSGRLQLRIERSDMGDKYEAYEKAVKAEDMAKQTLALNNTEETYENAQQAEINANMLFRDMLEDPQG
jgi:hypothetical protein